jgi:hypothetical protein
MGRRCKWGRAYARRLREKFARNPPPRPREPVRREDAQRWLRKATPLR